MGVHSLEKLGAKMGSNSFYYQRVRAERSSKSLGALNTLRQLMTRNLENMKCRSAFGTSIKTLSFGRICRILVQLPFDAQNYWDHLKDLKGVINDLEANRS